MTDVAEIARGLTKAQREDLMRAIMTAGALWVPCPSIRAPFVTGRGHLTPLGLAVRDYLKEQG